MRMSLTIVAAASLSGTACAQDQTAYSEAVECSALGFLRAGDFVSTDKDLGAQLLYATKLLGDRMQSLGKQLGKPPQEVAEDGVKRVQEIKAKGFNDAMRAKADQCLTNLLAK
jgi:hypothetical protein